MTRGCPHHAEHLGTVPVSARTLRCLGQVRLSDADWRPGPFGLYDPPEMEAGAVLLMTNMQVGARSNKVEGVLVDYFRDLPDLPPDARLWRVLHYVLHYLMTVY